MPPSVPAPVQRASPTPRWRIHSAATCSASSGERMVRAPAPTVRPPPSSATRYVYHGPRPTSGIPSPAMPIIDADRPMAFAPAVALLGALRAREVSARELLDLYLARIGSLEPGIGAVVTLDAERAMAAAAAADDARAAGDDRPLLGLPVTLQDSVEAAGVG